MAQEENLNVIDEKKKQFKKKLESVIISAALIVIGLLFCVLPTDIIEIIETVVLVGVLVYGGVCMLIYCFTPADFRDASYLIKAMISLCVGLLLMFVRSFFISAFGIVILISGVKTALSSRVYKAVGDKKWYMELLVGLVLSILSALVIVLSNLSVSRRLVFVLLGVTLIAQGVINMAFMFYLRADRMESVEVKEEKTKDKKEPETEIEQIKEVEPEQEIPVQEEPLETEVQEETTENKE